MRVLVDHSGYALLNIGDIAQLQACVRQIETLWPDAVIHVFTDSPERLEQYCPGAIPVTPTVVGRPIAKLLPISGQHAAEQLWKMVMPLLTRSTTVRTGRHAVRVLEAVRRAELVVSSGGGFVNDEWWWHGAGVLSVLAMAQRLGKPTAMFGQAVGPITHPILNRLAGMTMPNLLIVGVRESVLSVPTLVNKGVDASRIHITGDDALQLAVEVSRPPTGRAIGVNVRVAPYSGVDQKTARELVDVTGELAGRLGTTTVPLPVSRFGSTGKYPSDLRSLQQSGMTEWDEVITGPDPDIRTPGELKGRVEKCRVVVTGSYHGAVFALAAGVPAVCLTNSPYFSAKFGGLAAMFPAGCELVSPGPRFRRELSEAVTRAWRIDEVQRDRIHDAALDQARRGERAYEIFKSLATARLARVNA